MAAGSHDGRTPVDDMIWSCPDCDGDLERDAYGLWCPRCEMVVPYACLPADPDPEPYWERL